MLIYSQTHFGSKTDIFFKTMQWNFVYMSQCVGYVNTVKHDNKAPGGRLNKKDGLTRYGDSHVKDKTS